MTRGLEMKMYSNAEFRIYKHDGFGHQLELRLSVVLKAHLARKIKRKGPQSFNRF